MTLQEILKATRSRENQWNDLGIESLKRLDDITDTITGINKEDAQFLVDILDDGMGVQLMLLLDYKLHPDVEIRKRPKE